MGTECFDCHQDVHEGRLNEKYYPQKACGQCHITDSWAAVNFNHQQTGFALSGKHKETQCVLCHKEEEKSSPTGMVIFTGLNQDCITCHADQHNGQFAVEGKTNCSTCHGTDQWKPSQFDHNTARFKLDGAHVKVACEKCHKEEIIGGQRVVQYKLEQFECINCHQ